MDPTPQKILQRLKGIGPVLAQRLCEAGVDSPEKLVALGEAGLKQLRGVNPRTVASILEQATALAQQPADHAAPNIEALQQSSLRIQQEVQRLVAAALANHGDQLTAKKAERLQTQMRKLLLGLEQANATLGARPRRAAKGLAKVEKRLGGLGDGGVKALTRGLKKARKPIKRFLP